jgi:hypothetical protein
MKADAKTVEFKFERFIHASPEKGFDGWLDARISGTPWNAADSFLLNAEMDGLFYWHLKGTSHYGRFTAFDRPSRMQHTWVSPNTLGLESLVTVTAGALCDMNRFDRAADPVEWEVFRTAIMEGQGWRFSRVWTPHFSAMDGRRQMRL